MALEDEFRFGIPRDAAPKKKQVQWGLFPENRKQQLRKTHKDTDKDGVPDLWDCQPRNPFKQDRYTPEELDEISGLGPLKLGNYIGEGGFGAVHDIEVTDPAKKDIADKYVVKVSLAASGFHINNFSHGTPEGFDLNKGPKTFERYVETEEGDELMSEMDNYGEHRSVVDEYKEHRDLNLDDMDLMLPAKPTMVELEGGKRAFALLKPKVVVQTGRLDAVYDVVSEEHQQQVHDGMNQLSDNGLIVWDFVQGGVAQRSGGEKFQIFDTGAVTAPYMYEEKWGEQITDDWDLRDPDTGEVDALRYNDQVYARWRQSLESSGVVAEGPSHLRGDLGTPQPVPMPYSSKSRPTVTPDALHRDVDFGDSWEITKNYPDSDGMQNIVIEYHDYEDYKIELWGWKAKGVYQVQVDWESTGDYASASFPTYKQALFAMMRVAHLIEGEEGQLEWGRIEAQLNDTMAPVRIPTVQAAFAKYKNWGKWQRESIKKDDVQLKLIGQREPLEGDSTYVASMPIIQLSGYKYTEGDYRLNIHFTTRNWRDLSTRPDLRNVDMWDECYTSPEALAKSAHDAAIKIQRIMDRPETGNWTIDRIAEFMEHHDAEGMEMALRKRREMGRTNRPSRAHAGHTGSLLGNFIEAQKRNQSRMPVIR